MLYLAKCLTSRRIELKTVFFKLDEHCKFSSGLFECCLFISVGGNQGPMVTLPATTSDHVTSQSGKVMFNMYTYVLFTYYTHMTYYIIQYTYYTHII